MLNARLELDVTAALAPAISGGRAMRIHARVFAEPSALPRERAPAAHRLPERRLLRRRYWHCEIAEHSGYSMAEHLARRGDVVVALDHLGIGESSRPAVQHLMSRRSLRRRTTPP